MVQRLTTNALADNAVTETDITNGAVTNTKILTVSASKLTGALPAIDGSSLTGISAGAEIVSAAFDGGGSGGPNSTVQKTTYFVGETLTIDANKAGVFTYDCTFTGSGNSGGWGGMRIQLNGSTTGTNHEAQWLTGNSGAGVAFGRATFTSSGSTRSLTISGGSKHLHSSPGSVNVKGVWTVVYS